MQSCPRCRCIFPRTVRIRLYHFRGVHVATQGRSPQSDDAKDTAVEDGIAIPIFYHSIRAEPLAGNRGGVREIMWTRCGAVERLEPDAGSSGLCALCCSILGARQGLRSANLTAICQTVLGGKEAHCCEPTVGRVSC